MGGLLSFKGLLTIAVVCLALYFGWPIIEAILIMLPIPDPKNVAEKLKNLFSKSKLSDKAGKKGPVYTGNFNQAPETLGESDEDNEDDDIGKAPSVTQRKKKTTKKQGLSYGDSDEDDEEKDGANLIQLDSATPPTGGSGLRAAENIPKLAKPE